ncbi:MAG: hypothetical protein SV775_12345 [Thermodesulfobacteriota bacterium]|nr:hypothetical protein [Thermodesulfobacteriota bacterium]
MKKGTGKLLDGILGVVGVGDNEFWLVDGAGSWWGDDLDLMCNFIL